MAGGTGNAAAAIVHGTGLPSSLPGRNSIRMWMGGEFGGTDYGRFTFGNGFRTGLRFSRTQYVLVTGVHFGITSAKKGEKSHSNGPGIGLGLSASRLTRTSSSVYRYQPESRTPRHSNHECWTYFLRHILIFYNSIEFYVAWQGRLFRSVWPNQACNLSATELFRSIRTISFHSRFADRLRMA